ncbi:MAG TPA: glycoside hydrolase [Desulfobacteraceae bacterium]|nr:glycoside hydrolase [Desulfobacteraceae bacterium]
MLHKNYTKKGNICRVTFDILPDTEISRASVCGDFNGWNPDANPMKLRKDGRFSTTVSLKTGAAYHFKYLLDGNRWVNDWGADGYERGGIGQDNSVIKV